MESRPQNEPRPGLLSERHSFPLQTPSLSVSGIRRGLTRGFSFQRRSTIASASVTISSGCTNASSDVAFQADTWGPLGLNLLHSPPEPLIDFIFVHGLRGGSIKTWTKGGDPRLFWPQAWLPRDPDLQHVRIHSYGYNSDWGDNKHDFLDLDDFGRSLFGEMSTSPHLRRDKTPIILVGHSMGGLVIKKAYLFAQRDSQATDLASRIQCMFFMATPHRGSDSAKLLNNILRASAVHNSKGYITDLIPNSSQISSINDEFRHSTDSLQIWSFYETVRTKLGTSSAAIVGKESAIMGHKQEIVNPLYADHRNICKFDSPADPNYAFIRNSLVKATEDVLGDIFTEKADETRVEISLLETYLHITHDPEDDILNIESKKIPGSCEWLLETPSFRDWRDGDSAKHPLLCYWLTGQPGAGKSLLTCHTIRHLQDDLGVDTCYYVFRHGRRGQQTASSMLRALAFQMAMLHPAARRALVSMSEAGVTFDKDDERTIWKKIFVNGVLSLPIPSAQYWVIDGLDECINADRLLSLLCSLQPEPDRISLRVFFSSRRLPDLERHFSRFDTDERLYRHQISFEDTRADIQRLVEDSSDSLPVEPERRAELVEKLVSRSDGAFLWADLALDELGKVFDEDEINEALDQVPLKMESLYTRILEDMENNRRHIKLMAALLECAVCSTRPLKVDELQACLSLQLGSRVLNIERIIDELCPQLLRVDPHGNVQLVHATVGDFLLSDDCTSAFQLQKSTAHADLATVCLGYLVEDEMRPPRHPAFASKASAQVKVRSAFADYACTSWSEHLALSSSASDELFLLLDKFFRSNVLSWVEHVLRRKGNLYHLARASRNLQRYLDRRVKHTSPIGKQFSNIQAWQTDLARIALKFGTSLLEDPSAIHFVVPPLCPTLSGIHREFGNSAKGLHLAGITNETWDDCICYIDYRLGRAVCLTACDGWFAIGMKSGHVKLYRQTACDQAAQLDHGEPVRCLKFDHASRRLVSFGFSKMKMWRIDDATCLWTVARDSKSLVTTVTFTEDDSSLLTVDKHGNIAAFSAKYGIRIDEPSTAQTLTHRRGTRQVILDADICPNAELLVIAHRGRPPQIWGLQPDVMIGVCNLRRDTPGHPIMSVSEVLFNPNPAIELLAVSYQDGELAIFDRWAEEEHELKSVAGNALALSSSPDGHTLATGDAHGVIKLWDFETLSLMYCIRSNETEVRSLAFSGDGSRLYDIRDTKTKVWEPSVLLRKAATEESSISDSVAALIPAVDAPVSQETLDVTHVIAPPGAGCILAGRNDGAVAVGDLHTGIIASSPLYTHPKGTYVTKIAWNSSLIASADSDRQVEVRAIRDGSQPGSPAPWSADQTPIYETKLDGPLLTLMLHPDQPLLLISLGLETRLVDLVSREERILHCEHDDDPFRTWAWVTLPHGPVCVLGARAHEIDAFTCEPGPEMTLFYRWRVAAKDAEPAAIENIAADKSGSCVAVTLEGDLQHPEAPKLLLYRASAIGAALETGDGPKVETAAGDILGQLPNRSVKAFYGFYGDRAVFLDHDLWVRSVATAVSIPLGPRRVRRRRSTFSSRSTEEPASNGHFFVPREFISTSNGADPVLTVDGAVIFPQEGELGVIRNALEWTFGNSTGDDQQISSHSPSSPSMAGSGSARMRRRSGTNNSNSLGRVSGRRAFNTAIRTPMA
ncbi:hypothetical protein RB594_007898 [Gaeumannomyces avenae]